MISGNSRRPSKEQAGHSERPGISLQKKWTVNLIDSLFEEKEELQVSQVVQQRSTIPLSPWKSCRPVVLPPVLHTARLRRTCCARRMCLCGASPPYDTATGEILDLSPRRRRSATRREGRPARRKTPEQLRGMSKDEDGLVLKGEKDEPCSETVPTHTHTSIPVDADKCVNSENYSRLPEREDDPNGEEFRNSITSQDDLITSPDVTRRATRRMTTSRANRLKSLISEGVTRLKKNRLEKLHEDHASAYLLLPEEERNLYEECFSFIVHTSESTMPTLDNSVTDPLQQLIDIRGVRAYLFEVGFFRGDVAERPKWFSHVREVMIEIGSTGCRWPPEGFESSSQEDLDRGLFVTFHELVVRLLPKVRMRIKQKESQEWFRLFDKWDRDNDNKLQHLEVMQLVTEMGFDHRVLLKLLNPRGTKGGALLEIGFDKFADVMLSLREHHLRQQRQHDRMIKAKEYLDDDIFREFRKDLSSFYDIFLNYCHGEDNASVDELLPMLRECGLTPKSRVEREGIQKRLSLIDPDKGGTFNFNDFLHFVKEVHAYRQRLYLQDHIAIFQAYDKDANGTLDIDEVSIMMADLGLSPTNKREQQELGAIIRSADVDRSGTIDFAEFLYLVERIDEKLNRNRYQEELEFATMNGFTKENMRDFRFVFDCVDGDFSGSLSFDEVQEVLRILNINSTQSAFLKTWNEVDKDGNMEFDFLEFVEFLRLMGFGGAGQALPADAHKVQLLANELDVWLLRRTLQEFSIPKRYLLGLLKGDLLELFCHYMGVRPTDHLTKALGVLTEEDLLVAAEIKSSLKQG